MKKILLPTDFSDNSWNAIKYAIQLFKKDECMFYLLNTYTPIIYHFEQAMINTSQYGLADAMRDTSIKNLKALKRKIEKEFGNTKHKIETKSAFNMLISEVKEIVEEKGIDYVVMGTKGATGAKEVLFGSNTVMVFKNVKCPVLAIPDDFAFEAPHEILFPTDFEIQYQPSILKPIIEIAKSHIARVNILHVYSEYGLTEDQESNKSVLEEKMSKVAHLFHDVYHQDITDAINNFQIKTKINLLIMVNNKHSFFENLFFKSTLNQIGFHLTVPFLVIPSGVQQPKPKK
jgi:nucleotide-binding universal stress UspA family protein